MKEWFRSNERAVYRVANAAVLIGMVLLGGQGFLGTGKLDMAHLLMALAVLAVSACLNFTATRGRLLCMAILFVFFLTGVAVAGAENSFTFLKGFWPWLIGRGAVPEAWNLGYELVQTGLLTGLCYLAQMSFEKAPVLKMAAAFITFLVMAFCLFAEKKLNHYGVAFQFVFCVIAGMEWIQRRWKKVRSPKNSWKAHTLWVMPFLALYLVLLAAMPAPEKPYDWQWAKNIYWKIQENLLVYIRNLKWGSKEGFGMAFSGFSGDGELRGGLQEKSSQVMRIRVDQDAFGNLSSGSDGKSQGSIYLTGNVYDTFDGRGWYQNDPGYPGDVFLDTAETLYAVKNYNGMYQKDYLREVSLEIHYEDFNTGYVFAPLKAWSVESSGRQDYICAGGSLRWAGQKGYGTEYGLHYFRMNAGQQEFDRFLEKAWNNRGSNAGRDGWEENGEIWAEVLRDCERRNEEKFTWNDVVLYREAIRENYLGEISLSKEVCDYLKEITQNAETEVEKLRAMERMLRSFSYTLTPGELPDWVKEEGDFLDYFLLESRRGYCTYFATAFVLLARAEGIPARYVQGYCVQVPEDGEAYVDSSMAHAWPEVYLEGVGWIPFEPTPGYADGRYSYWGLKQPGNMAQGQEDSLILGDEPEEKAEAADNFLETENGAEESNEAETEEEGMNPSNWWKFLGIGIPMLLLACTVVLALDYAISRYRYKKMTSAKKFRMEVFRNLEILSRFGAKKEEWETLQELRERAEALPELQGRAETLPEPAGKGMENVLPEAAGILCFIEDYERVIYGGKEVGEDMVRSAVQARETLLRLLKQERKWAYFYCQMELFFGRYR